LILALLGLVACTPPGTARRVAARSQQVGAPLYGFWGLNGFVHPKGLAQVRDRLGMSVFHTATMDPAWATGELLPMVQAAGLQVTLRLSGDHHHYTTPGGDFSLDAWKRTLARWADAPLAPFIADGTLAGHMLLDDIENFDGQDPTAAELDEMARYSKALMPGLMTFVRQKASAMPPPAGGTYVYVDAVVNQYKAAEGDVRAYARGESQAAQTLDVGIINGLNIANGGDGSSKQAGWQDGRWAMSADEIQSYGRVLSAVPGCGMFLNWEYDGHERWSDGSVGSDYFDQPALSAALTGLGERLQHHRPVPLLKDD